MIFVSIFENIYSGCVFFLYSDECYADAIPLWLDSFFKGIDRFVGYILWVYPLLIMFWPTQKRKKSQNSYK